jgi:hypothetical protein
MAGVEYAKTLATARDAGRRICKLNVRLLRIVKDNPVQWPFTAQAPKRPLVALYFLGSGYRGWPANNARRRVKRDLPCRLRIGSYDRTLLEVQDKSRPRRGTQTHHWDAGHIFDLSFQHLGVIGRQSLRETTAALPRDRLQCARSPFLGDARKADIHHDDPRREPHHHQKPDGHAEIAVKDDYCLPDHISKFCRAHVLPSARPHHAAAPTELFLARDAPNAPAGQRPSRRRW